MKVHVNNCVLHVRRVEETLKYSCRESFSSFITVMFLRWDKTTKHTTKKTKITQNK